MGSGPNRAAVKQGAVKVWSHAMLLACSALLIHVATAQELTRQGLAAIEFEGSPNVDGYTVFFPVQRFICKVDVDVCAPEVLAQTKKWGHHPKYTEYNKMFVQLRSRKEFLPMFDDIGNKLLAESRIWGLDSVEVATCFVQSYPYVRGEMEKYPAESVANHYGDCSDMSVMLQRLLFGMGIRSELFLYRHYGHATVGIPLSERGETTPFAFVECTNFSPIGKVSLDAIGRNFSHEDSVSLDTSNPNAKMPVMLDFKQRRTEVYEGFDALKAQHRALERVLGLRYLSSSLEARLLKEQELATASKYPSQEAAKLLESLVRVEKRVTDAAAGLADIQDSLQMMCGQVRKKLCLTYPNKKGCGELVDALLSTHRMLPVMNMGLKAAEMEFDAARIQWNNWVSRNPWFLE